MGTHVLISERTCTCTCTRVCVSRDDFVDGDANDDDVAIGVG